MVFQNKRLLLGGLALAVIHSMAPAQEEVSCGGSIELPVSTSPVIFCGDTIESVLDQANGAVQSSAEFGYTCAEQCVNIAGEAFRCQKAPVGSVPLEGWTNVPGTGPPVLQQQPDGAWCGWGVFKGEVTVSCFACPIVDPVEA